MVQAMDALDPVAHLSAMAVAAGVLEAHAGALDALDGTPGQTRSGSRAAVGEEVTATRGGPGSDLAATLSAAVESAAGSTSFAATAAAMESGSRSAATGRAGRALAAFLGGMGEALSNSDRIDGTRFALGLEAGAERLAPLDDGRHPGGFVPVASAAADAALAAADRGSPLGDTVLAAANAGIEELERGPVLDATLAERGTVDAAAAGFLLLLDALASVITGEPVPEPPGDEPLRVDDHAAVPAGHGSSELLTIHGGDPGGRGLEYRVSCRLEPHDPGVEARADLEAALHARCHSIELLAAAGTWDVDATTTNPGAIVELLAGAGSMHEVRIAVTGDGAASAHAGPLATNRV